MSSETITLTPEVHHYLQQHGSREDPTLVELRSATKPLPGSIMQITPEQGQLMGVIVEMLGAKKTLDIGTYTGYSALVVALHLPLEGKVFTCDISEENTDVAKRFWQKAGVIDKIDMRIGPALETLQQLLIQGHGGTFDFIFIDADKNNYDLYYELSLKLLRQGGVIAVDNVLWSGRVADPCDEDKTTAAIRHLNSKIHGDARVSLAMVPIGDGLTLARKR